MYNWNTDIRKMTAQQKVIWQLNQLINYGLGGKKLDLKLVKKHWNKLDLDPKKKKFLRLIAWQ